MPPGQRSSQYKIDASVFIAKTATVVGNVAIGKASSVWFSAVLRGDIAPVTLGERTNVQDGAVLHVGHGFPCVIGDGTTIAHGAIVHGATVENDAMIGIGAIILNGAVIGRGSLVGAGAVVTENTIIPPDSLVLGTPGRRVRPVTEVQRGYIREAAISYIRHAQEYKRGQKSGPRRTNRKESRKGLKSS